MRRSAAPDGELDVLLGALLFGVLGILIGLRYRAPTLIPATLVAVGWGVATGLTSPAPVGRAILTAALLTLVLHAAYLLALALRTLVGRSSR